MKDEIKEILDELENYYDRDITLDEIKLIRDYITNLQEENHRLKELCDKYEEEHSTTFEYWKQLVKEDYKSRNEKAIEYIKRYESIRAYYEYQDGEYWEFNYDDDFQKNLLNILQGEDKE